MDLKLISEITELGEILADLGLHKIRLITNNPRKVAALKGYGLEIVERVPIEIPPNEVNMQYMQTKQQKMGHYLNWEYDEEIEQDDKDIPGIIDRYRAKSRHRH